MNREKFEYCLNALHYCIWLMKKNYGLFIHKIVWALYSLIPYLLTKEYKKKYYKRMAKWEEDTKRMRENKEVGLYIGLAHHWFGFYYSTYPGYFSFILIAFEYKLLGVAEVMLFFPVVLIPVAIGYIPAYKAVMYKDRYLKYFKQFEKEDEAWHGKWKRRTWAFCLGGIFVMALGIFTFWGILDFGIIRQMFF